MKKTLALLVMIIMMFSLVGCGVSSNSETTGEDSNQEAPLDEKQEQMSEEVTVEEPMVEQSMVDTFIEGYNSSASAPITDVVEVDVTDQASGHYRTEFRLSAFEDSIAKTGKIGDIVIDIVNCGWQKDELRIYADGITPEQAVEIVKYAAPIMDPDVASEDLQDVLDYLIGINDYHNGYFGELCLTFNKVHGQLMLRTD